VGTYQILLQLWKYANSPRHPLVRFELRRPPMWAGYMGPLRRAYGWTVRIAIGLLIVAVLMELVIHSRVSFMLGMLMLMLPLAGVGLLAMVGLSMIGWQIPLALAGSAMIVYERSARTWDILLTTPIPHSDILLAKLAVGLSRMQTFITLSTLLQAIPLLSLLGTVNRAPNGSFWLTLAISVLFVIDRAQQFALAGLLGLLASLLADTWSVAAVGAIALGAVLWLARTVITFGLTAALIGEQAIDIGQIVVIGLPALAGATRYPWVGTLMLLATLIAQEWIVRRLFAWMLGRVSR